MSDATSSKKHRTAADTSEAVDVFIAQLQHTCKSEVMTLRQIVLASDPAIQEGVKWNAPSYRTIEYFATTNLRAKTGIGLILHFGAKARDVAATDVRIDDPAGLLLWLAKDRAMIEFSSVKDIESKRAALQALVSQWIRYV